MTDLQGVSVVIPAFDAGRFLAEAIESARAQSLKPREIIVVDDGSSDDSAEVASRFGPPVLLLRHAGNLGGGAARNTGIQAATSAIVALLDADDRMSAGRLAREVAHLAANPHLAGVVSRMEMFCEPGYSLPAWALDPATGRPITHAAAALTVHRSVFARVGLFDATFRVADVEWLVRARDAGEPIEQLEACGTERRIHGANMSHALLTDGGAQRDLFRMLRARGRREIGRGHA